MTDFVEYARSIALPNERAHRLMTLQYSYNGRGTGFLQKKRDVGRPVRVEDVARVAGVSPITVSRALSQPEKVREETRRRVAEAVAETGYVVNSFASMLRSGRSSIVTVFVSSLLNPHFATAMQGLVDAFEGSRYHLMYAQTGYSEMLGMDTVAAMLPFRPAGIAFTGIVRSEATRIALRQLDLPVMEMWGDHDDPIDMLVGFSNVEGGRLMGQHFARRGFRHIAFCGHIGPRGTERLQGFRDGLGADAERLELIHPMEGNRGIPDGVAALDAILSRLPDCDAIFFGSDILAAGAILGALERGIDIPGQVAVAGYGGLDFAPLLRPPLTTVSLEGYQMGLRAGRMLLARLEGGTVSQPVRIHPLHIDLRASTGGGEATPP